MISAQHMTSLSDFYEDIPDLRRPQGRRHQLSTVLAIAAAATLCGRYLAISDWAKTLSPKARERFGCRYENRRYIVPSLSIIRDALIRVDPVHLDHALQRWNHVYAQGDESLAIDVVPPIRYKPYQIQRRSQHSPENAATHTKPPCRLRLSPHDTKLSPQNTIRLEQIYRANEGDRNEQETYDPRASSPRSRLPITSGFCPKRSMRHAGEGAASARIWR
jgi:hypothetical protein